jgi:TonB family protein
MGGDSTAGLSFSSPSRSSERRRHTRQDVIYRQLVPINLGADNGGLLLDLSAGGAAVQSVAPLKSSAASPFAFRLPQLNCQIEGTGVFVWVDDTGLAGGLRFDQLSPQAQHLVEQWLKGSRTETAPAPLDTAREALAGPVETGMPETTAGPALALTAPLGTLDPALAAKLRRVAERARILSRAKGACIALKDEQGAFLCEASIGTAPELGIPVNLERGLAAECVASKGLVLCNEAQNDPRVDVATRQQLSLGSAALLPLFAGDTLFGVLGVFSDRPHAFGEQEIRWLHDFTRTMETGVLQEVRGELKPISPPASAAVLRPSQAAAPRKRRNWGTSLATSALRTFIAATLGCAVLFSGLMLYQHIFAPVSPLPKLPPKPEPPSSVAYPANPASASQAGSEAAAAPTTAETTPARQVQPQPPARVVNLLPPPAPTERRVPLAALRSPATAGAPEVQQFVVTPPPEAAARQTAPAAAPAVNDALVPARSLTQQNEAQGRQGAPPLVRSPVLVAEPPPAPHVDVLTTVLETKPKAEANASQLPAPELTSKIEIPYPPAAVAQNRQGSVVLRVTVGRTGTVDSIRVLDGDQALTAEAVRTVRQWRYKPYKLAGREVGADLLVTVNFVLSP